MRWAIVFALLLACGSGQSGRGRAAIESVHDFPEPAELDRRLAANPAPTTLLEEPDVASGAWTIDGALPDTPAPEAHETDTAAGRMITAALLSRPEVKATGAAECLARQAAAHWLRTRRHLTQGRRRFYAARCGVSGPRLAFDALPLGAGQPLESVENSLLRHLDQRLSGSGLRHVGLAVADSDEGGVVMLVVEHPSARLHIVRPRPTESGFVIVRGRMLTPVRYVTGFLNRGATGVVECERANNLSLPEFALRCVMDPEDPYASLDIMAYEPDRVLGQTVASLMVRREGAVIGEYRFEPVGAAATPATADEFARAVLERVNGVRSEGGLPSLALARRQSQKMTRAVPHFFAPEASGELQDLIALSMIAGWDVDGAIQDAAFGSSQVRERDVSRWVSYALERPFMRHTLMSPAADQLAISALVEPGGTSAMLAHYEVFDATNPRFDEVAVAILDRITEVRVARGLPAPTEVRDNSALQEEVDRVRTDRKDVRDALRAALARSAREWNHPITGFSVHVGGNPRAMTVPDELLQPGELYLQAAATFHRPAGAAWGQYLVFVVTTR